MDAQMAATGCVGLGGRDRRRPSSDSLPARACVFVGLTGIILESENKYDPQQTQQKTIDLLDLATESVGNEADPHSV